MTKNMVCSQYSEKRELIMGRGKADAGSRRVGLDLVRTFAILFVIGAHFFMNSDFNISRFNSPSMFVQGMLQTLTMTNVPLFLILIGYLNLNKKIGKKYYRNMFRVIWAYLFFSVVTIVVSKYVWHEPVTLKSAVLGITSFTAIRYGWFIEMWIGLYLLTPFLNILWHNIESRKHRGVLIITLYLLSALPDFFNRYGLHLVPGYWETMAYPLVYYFIGAYFREYKPTFSKWKIGVAIVGLCLINPLFSLAVKGTAPMMHIVGDGNGIVVIPLASLFFMLCYDVKWTGGSQMLCSISKLSLDMYLVSYIWDRLCYPWFKDNMVKSQDEFGYYYLLIIGTVFVLSYISALMKNGIFRLIRILT